MLPLAGSCNSIQTGPSVTSLAVTQFTVPVQAFLLSANKFTAFYTFFYSTSTPPVNIWWVVKANSGAGTAHTGYDFPNTALAASYIIGNEIRLPEPSTQLGLASGLVLLGTLAALRTRRRARLH